VGKQSNAINLYYLNFLGTVMLLPLLVVLDSSGWDDSLPSTLLLPVVHSSTRFLLGADFFEIVLLPL
jgi:hypothetical protein